MAKYFTILAFLVYYRVVATAIELKNSGYCANRKRVELFGGPEMRPDHARVSLDGQLVTLDFGGHAGFDFVRLSRPGTGLEIVKIVLWDFKGSCDGGKRPLGRIAYVDDKGRWVDQQDACVDMGIDGVEVLRLPGARLYHQPGSFLELERGGRLRIPSHYR